MNIGELTYFHCKQISDCWSILFDYMRTVRKQLWQGDLISLALNLRCGSRWPPKKQVVLHQLLNRLWVINDSPTALDLSPFVGTWKYMKWAWGGRAQISAIERSREDTAKHPSKSPRSYFRHSIFASVHVHARLVGMAPMAHPAGSGYLINSHCLAWRHSLGSAWCDGCDNFFLLSCVVAETFTTTGSCFETSDADTFQSTQPPRVRGQAQHNL